MKSPKFHMIDKVSPKYFKLILFTMLISLVACKKDKKPPELQSTTELVVVKNFTLDWSIKMKEAYFIFTDENANIFKEVKFVPGTADLKIMAPADYQKSRFNMYVIKIPEDPKNAVTIAGFLQIQNGSEYRETTPSAHASKREDSKIKVNFLNLPAFTTIKASTDFGGEEINSPAVAASGLILSYGEKSKLWVEVEKDGGTFYNFFDIAPGTKSINVDMNTINKKSLVKTISAPGNISSAFIWGTPDKTIYNSYAFANTRSTTASSQLDYYYPAEPLESYSTSVSFINNGKYNTINYVSTSIPDAVTGLNADFKVEGKSLAHFKPTFSGSFDYYQAFFEVKSSSPLVYVSLTSPAAGNYTDIKLPDLSKYYPTGNALTSADIKLTTFSLMQMEGFDEKKFIYPHFSGNYFLNGKIINYYSN